jgi:hypothetical protein
MTLIALSHLILVYHCSLWRKERGNLTSLAGDWASDVKTKLQCLDDSVDILSEIADILESGGSNGASQQAELNWQQLATQAIMSRMGIGDDHGSTQRTEGSIHEEQETPNEQIQESDISSGGTGDDS